MVCPVNLSLTSLSSSLRAFAPVVLPSAPHPHLPPARWLLLHVSSQRLLLGGSPTHHLRHCLHPSSAWHYSLCDSAIHLTPTGSVPSPLYPSLQSWATHTGEASITSPHSGHKTGSTPPPTPAPRSTGTKPKFTGLLTQEVPDAKHREATSWSMRTFLRTFGSPGKPDAGNRRSSQKIPIVQEGAHAAADCSCSLWTVQELKGSR